MVWWLASAWAQSTTSTTSTCFFVPALPVDTLPRNGATDIPPEAVVLLDFGAPSCVALPEVEVEIRNSNGALVPSRITAMDTRVAVVTPDEPLRRGLHAVSVASVAGGSGGYAGSFVFSFVVEDTEAPFAGSFGEPDWKLRSECRFGGFNPSVGGPMPSEEGLGQVRTQLVVDGVAGSWNTVSLLPSQSLSADESVPVGLHEVCLVAELRDVTGTVVDTLGPECFQQRNCPTPPEDRSLCATAPGTGATTLFAAVLVVAGGRRRPVVPIRPRAWQDPARRRIA